MKIGVGYSCSESTEVALKNAIAEALKYSREPVFSMIFTAGDYDTEVISGVARKLLKTSKIFGARVPGIITRNGFSTKGIGIFTVSGSEIEAETFLYKHTQDAPDTIGHALGERIKTYGPDSGTVFCLLDGQVSNASEVLRALYDVLGPGYNYLGGGNGDNLGISSTYQFTQDESGTKSIVIAVVKGIDFHSSVDHGWKPTEEPLVVTSAENKRVYEIDGVPAFARYSMYTGCTEKASFPLYSMKHPLGIPCYGGKFLVRDPLQVFEDGSIEFLTEVPQNTAATIMTSDIRELIDTAGKVAGKVSTIPLYPRILLVFDCVSRYLLMKEDFQQEVSSILHAVNAEIPILGILSFGEICSVSGAPLFYNKSIVVAAGGE